MKIVKRIITGLFIIFLFFSFFSHTATSATTIDDTTFPADVGKTYKWKTTYPAESINGKFSFTAESIEKGVHNSIEALIVNSTIEVYNPNYGWFTVYNNTFYMAANKTQRYLAFGNSFGGLLIIPTPINLTLVAQAIFASNYSVVENTIIFTNPDKSSEEFTYNTKGFLTTGIYKEDGITVWRFVLDTGDGAIPFGNFFLIFTVISVIALVYLKKQKIK